MTSPFFNAHHSPIGAFATFTLGMSGAAGGLGLELSGPANEGFYIGLEEPEGKFYRSFPFYAEADSAAKDYDVEGLSDMQFASSIMPFAEGDIVRTLGASIDEWQAGDLKFRIYSPPQTIPEPSSEDAKDVLTPAVFVELVVDNRECNRARKAFFGYAGSDRSTGMRILDEPGLVGVGQGTSIAIASDDEGLYAGLAWQPEAILEPRLDENLGFMLGSIGLVVGIVPPNQSRTFRFAVAFFRDGVATTGIRTRYMYRRWFDRIEDVLKHTLANACKTVDISRQFDERLTSRLSPD